MFEIKSDQAQSGLYLYFRNRSQHEPFKIFVLLEASKHRLYGVASFFSMGDALFTFQIFIGFIFQLDQLLIDFDCSVVF